jgi:hypothetical protein
MVRLPCSRVSSKQTNKNFGSNRNKLKICFGCVLVCFVKLKTKNFGLFLVFRIYIQTTETKQNCFVTNRNNPKSSEKYQNMLSIKMFRFNGNIKNSLFWCRTETTLNFGNKIPKLAKYALYHIVLVALRFVLVQSKHRNSLFRYRTETTETNYCFG